MYFIHACMREFHETERDFGPAMHEFLAIMREMDARFHDFDGLMREIHARLRLFHETGRLPDAFKREICAAEGRFHDLERDRLAPEHDKGIFDGPGDISPWQKLGAHGTSRIVRSASLTWPSLAVRELRASCAQLDKPHDKH